MAPTVPRQVYLTCDARYEIPLTVVVYSLLKTARPETPLTVFVAHDGSYGPAPARQRLEAVVARFPFATIRFIDASALLARHRDVLASERNVWASVIWAGPLVGDVLPDDVHGNVVYLDVDMMVCRDLDELYRLDLASSGHLAAAVVEGDRSRFAYLEACAWPAAAGDYFNNGTMVIDLDGFRQAGISRRILAWYAQYRDKARFTDQDSQNAVFGDRTVRLHPRWNFNDGWLEKAAKSNPFAARWRSLPRVEILEAIAAPGIVHFINRKPWDFGHRPMRHAYHGLMRELGVWDPALAGQTLGERAELAFYDVFNGLLKRYAALQLAGSRAVRRLTRN